MARRSAHPVTYSIHAQRRADARIISPAAVDAAIAWGRRTWSYGDQVFRLDRRSVARARWHGLRLDLHEGVTVVLGVDGTIKTTFRNRDPRRILR